MASETDIANRALSKLGDVRIVSMSENTKAARAMSARFDLLRDAELAAHPWRFAIRRASLPALAGAPSWGYARAFQRPSDDLRTLSVGDYSINVATIGVQYRASSQWEAYPAPYAIVGQELHTDHDAPLDYEYVSRVTDTGLFPPLFVEALACRLAMDAAEEITQSAGKRDGAEREYAYAIRQARAANAMQRAPSRHGPGRWELSRYGG